MSQGECAIAFWCLSKKITHNLRAERLRIQCTQANIFLHNQNMAAAIGSVYLRIHKYCICVQLLLWTSCSYFCHIKAFHPLEKRGAALCLNRRLVSDLIWCAPPVWLHMKDPSTRDANDLTGCVHKEKYLTIQSIIHPLSQPGTTAIQRWVSVCALLWGKRRGQNWRLLSFFCDTLKHCCVIQMF